MLARVSHVETFRRWQHWRPLFEGDAEPSLAQVVASITHDHPSEAMLAGTAFHHALELAICGSHDAFYVDGYTFNLPDAELSLTSIREMRMFRRYGDLTVTGKADGVHGRRVIDHKTAATFDAERYLEGYQWRFYLDLFGADRFEWNVFEIEETDPKVYRVKPPHTLSACRYPGLADDCAELADQYSAFAQEHLPAGFDALHGERP